MKEMLSRRQFGRLVAGAAALTTLGARPAGASETIYDVRVDPSLFEGINRARDPMAPQGLELTHAPVITAPARVKKGEPFEVRIEVGKRLHVMTPPHYIQYIELFAGNEPIARLDLFHRFSNPAATLSVRLEKSVSLLALERCNLHGLWEAQALVRVE